MSTEMLCDIGHIESLIPQYPADVVNERAHRSRRSSSSSSGSSSRRESKELTRQALVKAALKLLSKNSFDSISLREITREAGITPTAFYRHFDDTEELGLVLVDESFSSLREMMRVARADPSMFQDAIHRSIEVLQEHVRAYEGHMRFIARERHGGVRRIRRAIRRGLEQFGDELAVDLAAFPIVGDWPAEDRRMFSSLIVETMVAMAGELIDASPGEEAEITARTEAQMRLIFVGVPGWRPRP